MSERDLLFAATALVGTATLIALIWQYIRRNRDDD
jgi:hypothetical protein